MTKQDLHNADVDAVLDQSRCVGMAQGVRRHAAPDAGRNDRGGEEAYPVDSGNATCSVSHSGDHGIAETNSRWREGTRFPSFKMRFPTRRIVWRSCSSAVGPAVSSAPPAARLAVLR